MKDIKFNIGIFVILVIGILGIIPGYSPFRVNKEIVCEWSIIFFIALCLRNKWISLFVIWSLINMMLSTYTPVGLNRAYTLTLHTIVFFSVAYHFISEKAFNINRILDFICVSAVLSAVLVFLQYRGVWFGIVPRDWEQMPKYLMTFPTPRMSFIVFKDYCHPMGFMDNSGTIGAFLALCLPAFFRKKWVLLTPLIIAGIFVTKILGGIVPAGVVIIFYIVWKWRRKGLLLSLLVLLGVGVWIYLNEPLNRLSSFNGRIEIWKFCVTKFIPRKLFTGWGLGQAQFLPLIPAMEGATKGKWLHYHNEYINMTIELGITGLIIFMGYLVNLFRKLVHYLNNEITFLIFLGIIVALLNMFVNFPMHNPLGILIITYLALGEKLSRGE